MAGDGGRVPDVSEQRADHETSDAVRGDLHGTPVEWPGRQPTDPDRGQLRDAATPASGRGRQSDPASVLAALLAESPEATVAAIEALLTGDEAVEATGDAMDDWLGRIHGVISSARPQKDGEAVTVIEAVCRSLLSKAPKEDG
jgi:hypothetical protein